VKRVMGLMLLMLCCGCGTGITDRGSVAEDGDGVGQPVPNDLYHEAKAKCTAVGVPPVYFDVFVLRAEASEYDGRGYYETLNMAELFCHDATVNSVELQECLYCNTAIVEAVYGG